MRESFGVGLARVLTWIFVLATGTPAMPARAELAWDAPHAGNPILPGYFADPSILHDKGRWYIYATIDPWGGDRLAVWESADFKDWTYRELNWPTKVAASSPTSGKSMVWAPSVVKGRDGRFWMYVSVGSEVWVGVAEAPLGPWRNALGDRPLIPGDFRPGFHMIDAEAFVDDDGQAYLYWGSGLDWVNGHCFAVRLKPDMVTFDGEPVDVTPAHYFEAPFMVKQGGRYYLTYSNGKTTEDSYEVRYAVGNSPLGPFAEAANSPILSTDRARQIISPGHHAVFRDGAAAYILYHRQALPFAISAGDLARQIAIDKLRIDESGIETVQPTHRGARPGSVLRARPGLPFAPRASSSSDAAHGPERIVDDNYATLWRAGARSGSDGDEWIEADLGRERALAGSILRPEYPGRTHGVEILASSDGRNWRVAAALGDYRGSPIRIAHPVRARYLRLKAPPGAGFFEWSVEGR